MDILRAYLCGCIWVKCYLKFVLVRGKKVSNCSEVFLEFALSVSNISLIKATIYLKQAHSSSSGELARGQIEICSFISDSILYADVSEVMLLTLKKVITSVHSWWFLYC